MAIILTFVVNAGLNFALGLVIAMGLGPADFGRYAIAMTVAIALNSILFDWLRLAAARFYSEETRASDPSLRATLELGYAAIALALSGLVAAACLTGADLGVPATLLAAATAAGVAMALFDYQTTLARARFLDRTYALLVLVKNGAAFVVMAGAAVFLRDPTLTLIGATLSAAAALLIANRVLRDPEAELFLARSEVAWRFARYGVPLVAANAIYHLIPLMNRSVLAADHGFAEAGQLALAADIGARLFMTVGSALDIVLFQLAVRADAAVGRAEAEAQVSRNLALVVALLLPFAVGYALVLPDFEALFAPSAYRGPFAAYSLVLIPALCAFSLILYALNPLFQLRQQTAPVVWAALAALVVNGALLAVLPAWLGPIGYAYAQLGGLAVALLVVLTLALAGAGLRLPWRDLGGAAAATGAMALAVWPLRDLAPSSAALALMAVVGTLVYAGVALLLNLAGARSALRARLHGRYAASALPAE